MSMEARGGSGERATRWGCARFNTGEDDGACARDAVCAGHAGAEPCLEHRTVDGGEGRALEAPTPTQSVCGRPLVPIPRVCGIAADAPVAVRAAAVARFQPGACERGPVVEAGSAWARGLA